MSKSNHYYNVNINTNDAHPTRCETRLEWAALGMNRYLCPVEVDNYVHFYSQVYGYPEYDIKRFKERGRLGYWLNNGLHAVLKRGVISNNNFSIGCNLCGENKSYSRKCQICGKMTDFKNLSCKAQKESISLYRSKGDLCTAPEKCSEIYIYAKNNIGECLKYGIKMDYLLNDKEIIKRGAILTTLFVKMLSNKKRRESYERITRERIKSAKKHGQDLSWLKECIV